MLFRLVPILESAWIARPRSYTGLVVLLLLALVAAPLTAAETPDQTIEKTYGPQIAAAKATADPKDDTALAQNMLDDAKTMANDSVLQAALLKHALPLTVEEPSGWALANEVLAAWVGTGQIEEAAAWQELVKCGRDALRRRAQGKSDAMIRPYFDWQLEGVWLALQKGDTTAADGQLNGILGELRQAGLKYEFDFVQQIQARNRFMAPFYASMAAACKRVDAVKGGPPNDDPKLNLAAGVSVLTETGDWRTAAPYLERSKDKTWDLILKLHRQRGQSDRPPAETLLPYPVDIFPGKHPSRDIQGAAVNQSDAPAGAPRSPAKGRRRVIILPVGMTEAMLDCMSEDRYLALKKGLDDAFKLTDQMKADYETSEDPIPQMAPPYKGPNGRYLPVIPDTMTKEAIDELSDSSFAGLKRAVIASMGDDYIKKAEENRDMVAAVLEKVNAKYPPGPNEATASAPAAAGDKTSNPAAVAVSAPDLLAAAAYLETLAAPTRKPSPVGRVALCREIAALITQAQTADQSSLNGGEKLGLITRQRAVDEAADKAVADLQDAFDKVARVTWVDLTAGGMKANWTSTTGYAHWKELADGVLEASDGNWDDKLTYKRVKAADFILDFEVYNATDNAHPILFLREHNGAPYFQAEFSPRHTYLVYFAPNANRPPPIVGVDVNLPRKTWTPVRIMFDDDHYMIWINHYQATSMIAKRAADLGSLCLVGLDGTYRIRNLRFRELK